MYATLSALSDWIGMLGVALILSAYYLLNTMRLSARDLIYQNINFVGSVLILFSLCFHVNIASIVIEIAWILISLYGIHRVLRERRKKKMDLENIK